MKVAKLSAVNVKKTVDNLEENGKKTDIGFPPVVHLSNTCVKTD